MALEKENSEPRAALRSKTTVLVILLLAVAALSYFVDLKAFIDSSLRMIEDLGPLGPVIFIGLYILACILFLPGSLITLGAGAIFGVVSGTVYVSVGSTIGATFAFLIGRYLARDWVTKLIAGNAKFAAIDDAVAQAGWKIVFLTRLSPVFPFNLLNYAFGLTKVSLRDYFLASWIGMFPGTVMYVYLGSLAGELARLSTTEREKTPMEWALYLFGLVATIIITVYVTKLAKSALSSQNLTHSDP